MALGQKLSIAKAPLKVPKCFQIFQASHLPTTTTKGVKSGHMGRNLHGLCLHLIREEEHCWKQTTRLSSCTHTLVVWSVRRPCDARVCQSGFKVSQDNNPCSAPPQTHTLHCRLSLPAGSQDQSRNRQEASKELEAPFLEPGHSQHSVPDPSTC